MKYLVALLISFMLVGCGHMAVKPTVVEQQYIVRIPPADLITPPPKVEKLDVDKATQGDVSKWLLDKEAYTKSLEDKLKGIANFFVDVQKDPKADK